MPVSHLRRSKRAAKLYKISAKKSRRLNSFFPYILRSIKMSTWYQIMYRQRPRIKVIKCLFADAYRHLTDPETRDRRSA